jgi:taurine--2-oxoglutarate transaminase
MQRLKLVERARELGPYVGQKLAVLKNSHPSVGDVRGLGLFWAVELVKNRETKHPLNTKAEKMAGKPMVVEQVAAEMMKNGVSVQAWLSHFVIAPPLIIEKSDIDFAVSVMDHALSIADKHVEA